MTATEVDDMLAAVGRVVDAALMSQARRDVGAEPAAAGVRDAYDGDWIEKVSTEMTLAALVAKYSSKSADPVPDVVAAMSMVAGHALLTEMRAAALLVGVLADDVAKTHGGTASDVLVGVLAGMRSKDERSSHHG